MTTVSSPPRALILGMCTTLAVLFCSQATAQSHSHGYVWAGPGVPTGAAYDSNLWMLAIGGEAIFKQKFGFGAEAGGLGSRGIGTGAGLISVNGYFHVPRDNSRFDPFLTGGYSATVPYGISFANFGGGVNWWFSRHVGLKLQVRDYLLLTRLEKGNLVAFGFGVAFR